MAFFQRNPDAEVRIVAERDGRIAGFGALVVAERELRACYVHPEAGRRGVGRALVAELESRARAAGLKALELDASLNAEAFYRALGYRTLRHGIHLLHRAGRDIPMPCAKMRKALRQTPP